MHMYALNLSIKSQDLWMSLYGLQVKMCIALEVNFTDTALFQTKDHWAVTERRVRGKINGMKRLRMATYGAITSIQCVLHMHVPVCLCLRQMNSTTN